MNRIQNANPKNVARELRSISFLLAYISDSLFLSTIKYFKKMHRGILNILKGDDVCIFILIRKVQNWNQQKKEREKDVNIYDLVMRIPAQNQKKKPKKYYTYNCFLYISNHKHKSIEMSVYSACRIIIIKYASELAMECIYFLSIICTRYCWYSR